MSETSSESQDGRDEQQQDIAEVDEELDARADGEGLGAEAGRGEETGISEG